jgi:hypothetical protein
LDVVGTLLGLGVGVTLGCSVGLDVVGDLFELEVGVTLGLSVEMDVVGDLLGLEMSVTLGYFSGFGCRGRFCRQYLSKALSSMTSLSVSCRRQRAPLFTTIPRCSSLSVVVVVVIARWRRGELLCY